MDAVFSKTQTQLKADFANAKRFDATFKGYQEVTVYKDVDKYTGEYEVTPADVPQTLQTAGKHMSQDVTINAIPKEYGRVTYDNTKTITVS